MANLENQTKTMEGWLKMHFPMWRMWPNANQNKSNFEPFFDRKKHENLKRICIKSVKKIRLTKEGLSRPIFDDFWLILAPFWGQNESKTNKNGVAFFS